MLRNCLDMVMKIGILGSGEVGKALARGFASRGNDVMIGSREPSKLDDFVREANGSIRTGTFEQTAGFGELIVLATLFAGTKSAIELAGPANFAGKPVIDATNPLKFEEGKLPALSTPAGTSAGEEIQRWLPQAKVVKALNTIGNSQMVDPKFSDGKPVMFIAGNDDGAKRIVAELISSLGWEGGVVDIGGIEEARYLEALAMLWIHFGFKYGSWDHGFALLGRHRNG